MISNSLRIARDIWHHPANRGIRLRTLLRAVQWQCWKRLTGRGVVINFHGYLLQCDPRSHSASRALYFSSLPDYPEMRFMIDYLRPGDHFVDVGANIGLYTLLAASLVGPRGHVYALEPGNVPAARLAAALTTNRIEHVTLHRVAAAERGGTVAFDGTEDDCTARVESDVESETSRSITSVRLDELLPSRAFAMAKFDIEGYEPFGIRGMSKLLESGNPPVVQLEVAGYTKRFGISTPEFIAELGEMGYDTAVYQPDSKALEFTQRPWEIPTDNVLALSRDHLQEITVRLSQVTRA